MLEAAILDAAEGLCGLHGPAGVSLRQIAAKAGSANHFAVQYYFKTKDNLIKSIIRRRIPSLEHRRGELLDAALRDGRSNDPRTLLEVLFRPIAEERDAEGRRTYAAFLFGIRVFGDLRAIFPDDVSDAPLTRHVVNLLQASAGLDEPIFFERLHAVNTVFLAAVADLDRGEPAISPSQERQDSYLARVLDFGAAGLTAPIASGIAAPGEGQRQGGGVNAPNG